MPQELQFLICSDTRQYNLVFVKFHHFPCFLLPLRIKWSLNAWNIWYTNNCYDEEIISDPFIIGGWCYQYACSVFVQCQTEAHMICIHYFLNKIDLELPSHLCCSWQSVEISYTTFTLIGKTVSTGWIYDHHLLSVTSSHSYKRIMQHSNHHSSKTAQKLARYKHNMLSGCKTRASVLGMTHTQTTCD